MANRHILLSLTLILCVTEFLHSQITIGKIEKQKDTAVLRPTPYDSLNDFEYIRNTDIYQDGTYIDLSYQYKKYIGQKIYVPPMSDGIDKENQFCNKYFTIMDVIFDNNEVNKILQTNSNVEANREFIKDTYWGATSFFNNSKMFLLRNDSTKKTFYSVFSCSNFWDIRNSHFILVPYFVKQKQLYQNKTLVYNSYSDFTAWKDIRTDKYVKIYHNSKWYCSEVTILTLNCDIPNFSSYNDARFKLYYVLKNDLGETIALKNLKIDSDDEFITKDEYDKKELEKKLKSYELIAKKKQEKLQKEENEKKAQEKRKVECINKFGEYYGSLIAQGEVKIGMNTDMCKSAWGAPFDSYKTTTADGIYEDWYYGWKYSLHFVNGLLIRIEN